MKKPGVFLIVFIFCLGAPLFAQTKKYKNIRTKKQNDFSHALILRNDSVYIAIAIDDLIKKLGKEFKDCKHYVPEYTKELDSLFHAIKRDIYAHGSIEYADFMELVNFPVNICGSIDFNSLIKRKLNRGAVFIMYKKAPIRKIRYCSTDYKRFKTFEWFIGERKYAIWGYSGY